MSDVFDRFIDPLIGREGGYSDHPADRGGPTRWGITQTTARRYGYTGAMSALPREEAVRIYRERYWREPGFNWVATRSEKVAEELLDTGVNMGPAVAVLLLQRALNVLYAGDPIKADGDIGPATLGRLRAYLDARPNDGEGILLKALNVLQGERYIHLAEANPSQRAFINGWLRTRVAL